MWRPHVHRHRSATVNHPERRHDRGHRSGAGGGERHPQSASGHEGRVLQPAATEGRWRGRLITCQDVGQLLTYPTKSLANRTVIVVTPRKLAVFTRHLGSICLQNSSSRTERIPFMIFFFNLNPLTAVRNALCLQASEVILNWWWWWLMENASSDTLAMTSEATVQGR